MVKLKPSSPNELAWASIGNDEIKTEAKNLLIENLYFFIEPHELNFRSANLNLMPALTVFFLLETLDKHL